MKRILDIGHNDLRLFLKSRTSYIWLFAMPLTFVIGIGAVFRGPGDPSNRFPPVIIENRDTGYLGGFFVALVKAQGLWQVDPAKGEKADRGIRIPADFTARLQAKQDANVEFFSVQGSSSADALLVEARTVRALITLNSHLLEAAAGTATRAFPTEEALQAVRAKPDPVALDAKFAGRQPVPSGFNFSLPGNLVNFLMMNLLIFGGATVAATRRNGVLRRLMTLPVRRGELVAGQIYGLWLLGAVQIVFFLVVGRFVLHVNLGANLPAVALVLLVFAWVAAAMGILVGSLIDAPDRVAGVCVLASLLMAAIGGCWFPMEVAPDWVKMLGHCVPTGWALDGLHRVISFGRGFEAVGMPLLALAGFGVAATVAAARWFRV